MVFNHPAVSVAVLAAAALLWASCAEPRDAAQGDQAMAIVNGITESNHRYVVGIGGSTRAFCTGTVISRRTVLTAAHCIGGVRNIFLGPRISGGAATLVPVVDEIRHPMYRDLPNDNATFDLGILQLGDDAPVQAVPLLRDTMTNTPRFIGPSLVFVGYGATSGSGGGSGTKRVVTFPIHVIGPAVVGNSYPAPDNLPGELFYYLASETMNRGTCSGDSGGPGFFVENGVELLAGVTSSGDADCELDGANQRSDQPYIDGFIQAYIDAFESDDPCRSNGTCDESCNQHGQLGDPDCAALHCGADGMCAEACVAPLDPDCTAVAVGNCGDNGVCDPACAAPDPDCTRQCGAEGNCLAACTAPDPDCGGWVPPDAAPPLGPDAGVDAGASGVDMDDSGGCGCRADVGSPRDWRGSISFLMLALGAVATLRRRRGG